MLKNVTSNQRVASKRGVFSAFIVIALFANVAVGQQRASTSAASSTRSTQQTTNEATTVFRGARDLIDEGQWSKAQEKFEYYIKTFPNDKSIEPALYWLAYTQQKLGRYDQMRGTIDRLLQKYPNTTWREDARLLLAQMSGSPGFYEGMTPSRAQRQ